jgi:hypothetical protein
MAQPQVTVVSTNPETLESLQGYLREGGVDASCTRDLGDCATAPAATTIAFILFPDDFRWEQVIAALADLAAHQPRALPVLVTAHPQRFERLFLSEDVLIVPRPVWGWKILDAIRDHAAQQSAPSKGGSHAP